MTFPRRLTPSDRQRETIAQQRMAPGSALGVGSRHVRRGDDVRQAGASTGGSGGIAARGAYTASAWAGEYFGALDLSDDQFGIGEYITVVGDGSLLMELGWYQVQGTFKADGLTAGNVCAGFVDVQDVGTLNDNPNNSVVVPPTMTGSGLFTAASVPFYTEGGGDSLRIGLSCFGGTPSFTTASLFVVRFA